MNELKPKVYIAAPFPSINEMKIWRKLFEIDGFEVVSHWIDGSLATDAHDVNSAEWKEYDDNQAVADFYGVSECDILVLNNLEEWKGRSRGGKNIEFGMAAVRKKIIIIVGKYETPLHHLIPQCRVVPCVEDAIQLAKKMYRLIRAVEVAFSKDDGNSRKEREVSFNYGAGKGQSSFLAG